MRYLSEEECRYATGLPFDKQQILRSGDFAFITKLGEQLQITDTVICTANYMTNFFFTRRSYLQYDRHIVSAAALLLSCKLLNFKRPDGRVTPIKLASKYHTVLYTSVLRYQSPPPYEEHHEKEYLDKFFRAEFKLMKTLEFDFEIELPMDYIEKIVDTLYTHCEDRNLILTMARAMANESFRSIANLCMPALTIATASVVLAGVICNMPKPHELLLENAEQWWTHISPQLSLEGITKAISIILEALSLSNNNVRG